MPLYGPVWPLKKGNHDTFAVYESIRQQISFELKNLLLTSPGENISDPNYGVGLRRFLFEQNTESVRSELQNEILSQIGFYMPSVIVTNVIVGASSQDIDNNSLIVRISYILPSSNTSETFELDLNQQQPIGLY